MIAKKRLVKSYALNRRDLFRHKFDRDTVLHFVQERLVSRREALVYLNQSGVK